MLIGRPLLPEETVQLAVQDNGSASWGEANASIQDS
jgi:hypothetical protein